MTDRIFSYPWYLDDWFKSETRVLFTLEERGLYRELIDLCWDKGSLPNNMEMLARLVAAPPETRLPFNQLLKRVLAQFTLSEDNRWHHPKVDEKRSQMMDLKDKRREWARRGGEARAKQLNGAKPNSHKATHKATLVGSPSPSPSPSPTNTEIESKAAAFSTDGDDKKTPPPPPSAGKQTRKPPGMEIAPDFSAHDVEKVELVRAYMGEIAKVAHLPPCDDQLLARVLEVCRAVHVKVIFDVIRDLVRRRRFENVQSWGLIPLLLQNYFKARAAGA